MVAPLKDTVLTRKISRRLKLGRKAPSWLRPISGIGDNSYDPRNDGDDGNLAEDAPLFAGLDGVLAVCDPFNHRGREE